MQNVVVRGLFVAIGGIIFVGTIVLNLLAIVYILSTGDKTSIAMLVVNLAIADIIHAMGIIFFSSNLYTTSWVFGEFGCKFSLTIDVLCTVVIVYTVAALSVERYIDARSTLTAKFRSLITFGSLVLIWTLGLLMPYPLIFYTFLHPSTNHASNSTQSPILACESSLSERTLLVYEIVLNIVAFIIPYLIIVVFSLKLLKFLRDWLKRKEKLTRASISRKRTRGVKLVLCIVLSFLICYTPFWAFKFYTRFLVDETIRRRPLLRRFLSYAHQLVILLSHFEGILNPLFFIVLTERFCLTLSKHRQRRSKPWATNSSRPSTHPGRKSAAFTSGNGSIRKTVTTTTARTTEINGLLSLMNNNGKNDEMTPVVVQSHLLSVGGDK